MGRGLRRLAVLHPFPSLLNSLLVLGLAMVAAADLLVAGALALAMLGLQFSIGAANDYFDADLDALSKPSKPIPAGLLSRPAAALIAAGCGAFALWVAAIFDLFVLAMAAAMLAAGLAYDALLKRGPWGWIAYAVAFPILPLYAWYGAAGELPPRYELLLPVAALAGPALQLANGLVDVERDRAAGIETLVGRLGRSAARRLMAALLMLVHGIAWLTLISGEVAPAPAMAALVIGSGLAAVGIGLSTSSDQVRREQGWKAQAVAIALLALGWLSAVVLGRA